MIRFSPLGAQRSKGIPDEGPTTKQETIRLMQDMKDANDIEDSGGQLTMIGKESTSEV